MNTNHFSIADLLELQTCRKGRFGVSWQITPDFLWPMNEDNDKEGSREVMKALHKMNKVLTTHI